MAAPVRWTFSGVTFSPSAAAPSYTSVLAGATPTTVTFLAGNASFTVTFSTP